MRLYTLLFFYTSLLLSGTINAQSNVQPADKNEIIKAIYHYDSLFWKAYNACDVEKMANYFTDDIEFYHDKGGPTFGSAKFQEAIRTGMCGKADWRLRREVIAGTVKKQPNDFIKYRYKKYISPSTNIDGLYYFNKSKSLFLKHLNGLYTSVLCGSNNIKP